MIDVKKFVTGFLVLAVSAGAASLIVSNIGALGNSAGATANNTAIVAAAAGQSGTSLSGDAFLPQAAADADVPQDQALASSTDPNNLTNALANTYLNDLVSINPDGPTVDDNGNESLTPPDAENVIAQLASDSSSTNLQIPDWDAEAAEIPIITIQTSSPDAVSNYSSAIQDIFNQDFVQPNLQDMLNDNTDPSAGSYIEPKIQSALQDIAGLQTPVSLASFQKSLITLLVYEKNTIDLSESVASSSDPLETTLVLQAESQKYDTVVQNFQNYLQQAAALTGFSPVAVAATSTVQPTPPSGPVAIIDKALGINTAYAIFGLGDIIYDPTIFAHLLLTYAEDIALQIAKNLIIYTMQKTVLTWIRGSGSPRFIQQWGTTLVNAYTQSAVNALNSQMQCISTAPFQAQVKLTLGATYQPNTNVCAVQFNSALAGGNLTKFYNNFSSGGWLTFGSTLQPGNNYYGSVFFAAQAVANTAQNAQNAAQAKAIASQGWKSTAVCDDGMDPDTGCKLNDALGQVNGNQMCVPNGGGAPYAPTNGDGNGECADGQEPDDIQPGQVVGQVFNSGVDSSGKLTTAANSIAGLLDSFTTSLLNSLATGLITATTGALENIGSTGGSTGGSNGSTSGQSGQVDISCTPTFQQANPYTVTFIGAGGQTISVSSSGTVTTSQPWYTWSVQDALGNIVAIGAGEQFTTTLNASGTYYATITDTTLGDGGANSQCNIAVPAPQ